MPPRRAAGLRPASSQQPPGHGADLEDVLGGVRGRRPALAVAGQLAGGAAGAGVAAGWLAAAAQHAPVVQREQQQRRLRAWAGALRGGGAAPPGSPRPLGTHQQQRDRAGRAGCRGRRPAPRLHRRPPHVQELRPFLCRASERGRRSASAVRRCARGEGRRAAPFARRARRGRAGAQANINNAAGWRGRRGLLVSKVRAAKWQVPRQPNVFSYFMPPPLPSTLGADLLHH